MSNHPILSREPHAGVTVETQKVLSLSCDDQPDLIEVNGIAYFRKSAETVKQTNHVDLIIETVDILTACKWHPSRDPENPTPVGNAIMQRLQRAIMEMESVKAAHNGQ